MTFKKEGEHNWNLNRFATDINYICVGVASKLLCYLKKKYTWYSIKSFADRRWTTNKENNLYTKLGFTLNSILQPDYKYIKKYKRIHKFSCRKQILHKKYNLPLSMTEKEMCNHLKLYKIWDCGLFKYVLYNC